MWERQIKRAYLAEVADGVASLRVPYSHDVKEEGFHIIVERFVVQEELGQKAEILTILFVALAIYFPN
jgi:hypothetical protein